VIYPKALQAAQAGIAKTYGADGDAHENYDAHENSQATHNSTKQFWAQRPLA
jgi:hypothetical protein